MCPSVLDLSLDRPVTFDAGQFVVLEAAEVMGGRAFSMVNYRRDAETLKFVIKRKPDGKFSNWLFDRDVKGENVDVYGPLGKATFHPDDGKNVLCLAGGSGIAGIMSIITRGCEEAYFRDHKGYVFFCVCSVRAIFFLDELSAFVAAVPVTF